MSEFLEYWGDPSGAIHRMNGEQEIIAVVTPECTNQEYETLCSIHVSDKGE